MTTRYLPVYGLKIGKEYLIRIRCRQKGNENYGEFSDVLLIPTIASIGTSQPLAHMVIAENNNLYIVLTYSAVFFSPEAVNIQKDPK